MSAGEQSGIRPSVLLAVEEAARARAAGRTTVNDLLAASYRRSDKTGGARRIPREDIREYVADICADRAGERH